MDYSIYAKPKSEKVIKILCFYCNKPNTDRVYTSAHGARVDVHQQCVPSLKRLIQEPIYELTERRKNK